MAAKDDAGVSILIYAPVQGLLLARPLVVVDLWEGYGEKRVAAERDTSLDLQQRNERTQTGGGVSVTLSHDIEVFSVA